MIEHRRKRGERLNRGFTKLSQALFVHQSNSVGRKCRLSMKDVQCAIQGMHLSVLQITLLGSFHIVRSDVNGRCWRECTSKCFKNFEVTVFQVIDGSTAAN